MPWLDVLEADTATSVVGIGMPAGRHFRGGYGGYGGGYGCNNYYGYDGCGYNPGAAVVGGLIGEP